MAYFLQSQTTLCHFVPMQNTQTSPKPWINFTWSGTLYFWAMNIKIMGKNSRLLGYQIWAKKKLDNH